MAASAKLDLLILTEYSQASRIKRSVENHGAELPVIVESVTLWEDLNLVLQNRVRKGDVILLNGARKETISWTQHSDQLPGSVSEQFPDNSLIVVYPRIKNRKFNSYFDPCEVCSYPRRHERGPHIYAAGKKMNRCGMK